MSGDPYSSYIQNIKRLWTEVYPDLLFGSPGRAAFVRLNGPLEPIRYIRVSVHRKTVMHLHHIEILVERDGRLVDVAHMCQLEIGSIWPDSEQLVEQKTFLTNHGSAYGFHTRLMDAPWVCVDLVSPATVRVVRIHNRTDAFAYRAWGFMVETSSDGKDWATLYDQAVRQDQFTQSVLERSRYVDDASLPAPIRELFDNLIACSWSTERQAQLLIDASPDPDVRGAVFAAANREFLFERHLERTGHGIVKTFRFWTDEEKSTYIRQCMWLVGKLEEWGFSGCLGYGAVLGVLRSQELIPHDDDLDIIVCAPRERYRGLEEMITDISSRLAAEGAAVLGDYWAHRHVWREGWGNSVDLFFGFAEGEHLSWFPGPRRALLASAMFPPIEAELHGVAVKLPRNPFHYVSTVYGPDWRRPQVGWTHSWDFTVYYDWLEHPPEG